MWWLLLIPAVLAFVALYDILQTRHALLRNFPIIGHFRYWLEAIGPELRQYIVTNNDEERPFSRDQRRWVYASAKLQNNLAGFGTDNAIELLPNYLIIKHAAFPKNSTHDDPLHSIACAKVLGGARLRAKAFRPESVVSVSAMSFGSLSHAAVEAINRGCAIAHSLQNTGEGGIAPYHRQGGDLIWQLGTGYFGSLGSDRQFSYDAFRDTLAANPSVRAVEVKLSQGAKPGKGGILPAAKLTEEIAAIRGVPMGMDVISPPGHRMFSDVDSMLDFVERLADESGGLPVGIKSAVGETQFWVDLADLMATTDRGVDFIAVDGGEGGTGAAPLAFSDHVALPFKRGFSRVYRIFQERGVADRIVFIGSGRLGFPEESLLAFALGCDMIGVAREALLAIGCIQAQRCHTGHCPTGVTTHNKWLVRGLDPTHKSARLANYLVTLRKEILDLTHACGADHPAELTLDAFEILDDCLGSRPASAVFGYPDASAGTSGTSFPK